MANDVIGKSEPEIDIQLQEEEWILYGATDTPPISVTIIGGFQHLLLSLSAAVVNSFLVADVVCANDNLYLKNKLLSASLFMNGFTTMLSSLVGIRLPLIQASSADFIVPLMAMAETDTEHCKMPYQDIINRSVVEMNSSVANSTGPIYSDFILSNIQELQGSLMLVGLIHILIGATGIVGFLLKYIGPLTVVPTVGLMGIYLSAAIVKFNSPQWGIGFFTCAISLIMSLYLKGWSPPIPVWTQGKGFHVIRYPVHQVFAILIAVIVGWIFSGILTLAGAFPDDPKSPVYLARTDAQTQVMFEAEWFHFPYPGQFGPISFSVSAFVGFFIAIITSILDSIGDYYACASMCRVPPPPKHGVNRGIAVEGFCCFMCGLLGCGHATTTYGGNIGAMGVTRVASRKIFMAAAIMYLVIGVIGKFSAVFITIPPPVLGGALLTMLGMFLGVVLSNLKHVDLDSSRNMAVIGISILTGLSIPRWIKANPGAIQTGSAQADKILSMVLANPVLSGGALACFLDNTIPGTKQERGISLWNKMDTEGGKIKFRTGREVYDIWMPRVLRESKIRNWIPFLPNMDTVQ